MEKTVASKLNPELLESIHDSTLAFYLGDAESEFFALGRVETLEPGTLIEDTGTDVLYVVLDGRIASKRDWYGPGNHLTTNGQVLQVLDHPVVLWSLDLTSAAWTAPENLELRRKSAKALLAADAAEVKATPTADLPTPESLCDYEHPEIRRVAARLRRTTPAGTAEAILQYIAQFPYRFGAWQERASDTLARGSGMCTTKSNLQVALMRASGLEAGFAEAPVSTKVLGKLMPTAWLKMQREEVRHYFAAVKLNGVWHACDSSYDEGACEIYRLSFPWLAHRILPTFGEGRPYCLALELQEVDLFGIEVVDNLHTEMTKKSRFKPRHFEALNVRLDRVRAEFLKDRAARATAEVNA